MSRFRSRTMAVTHLFMLILVSVSASNVLCNNEESRLVHTLQGPVRGYKDAETGVFSFYNVPYATTPKGVDKFKAPLPPPTWKEPLEAVYTGYWPMCPQPKSKLLLANLTMEEDCLLANVHVPNTEETNLPVLIHIHGGGFQIGLGNMISMKHFQKEKKFIVVTFNYRLGVHGFLCLGTEKVPGNAGLKDQVALLRWVKKNIASFGGNPDDVTLGGGSAGAIFTDVLQLVPSATGLFNKVIPESGSSLAPFTVQIDPLEQAKAFAKKYYSGNVDDVYELEQFFITAPFDLLNIYNFLEEPEVSLGFSPCVERPTGEEMILTDAPFNILKSGNFNKVPNLYGNADMEGILRMMVYETFKNRMNEKFSDFLPTDLKFDSEEQREAIAKTVKEEYFGTDEINDQTIQKYIDYFSDTWFSYPAARSVNLQYLAGNDKIFFYEYSFADVDGTPLGYKDYTASGANHCDQTRALVDEFFGGKEKEKSFEYQEITSLLRDIWYNFITTGIPETQDSRMPTWPPLGEDCSPHMNLGNTVELKESYRADRMRFWDAIYEKHYNIPKPPPAPPKRNIEL